MSDTQETIVIDDDDYTEADWAELRRAELRAEESEEARQALARSRSPSPRPAAAAAAAEEAAEEAPKGPMSKRWAFTCNNPGDWRPIYNAKTMAYLVWEHEVGDQGTPHIQGYVRFTSKSRLATAQNKLNRPGLHMDIAEGNEKQNRDYCMKEAGKPGWEGAEEGKYEPGAGAKGHRSDLDKAVDLVKERGYRAVATEFPKTYVLFHKGLAELEQAIKVPPPAERPTHNVIIWGNTGVGKSHLLKHTFAKEDMYWVVGCPGRGPFDKYKSQKILVLDEFEYGDWNIRDLNGITDKWDYQVRCRYADKEAYWEQVYILANDDPNTWWTSEMNSFLGAKPKVTEPQLQAFRRRFSAPMGLCYYKATQEENFETMTQNPIW